MTIERTAELIKKLQHGDRCDLFNHFVRFFDMKNPDILENFAEMSGFIIATTVVPTKKESNES